MKNIRLKVDPFFLAVLPVMIITGYLTEYILILISIILHEAGHIISALLLGRKLHYVKLLPAGLNASLSGENSSAWRNLAIYACGPAVNALLAAIVISAGRHNPGRTYYTDFFILVNICLGIFNMIPVLPLDGGRIIREILAFKTGSSKAGSIMYKISFFLALGLIFAGIIQLTGNIYNFSVLLVGIYVLITIKMEKTEAALMNIKSVIYRRSRLLKKGIYQARDLVVIKSMRLGEVIKNMDFDRFHIIYVLDDNLKVMGVYTEQEIIDAMLKYNTDITFEDMVKNKV
ncbi:MAG: M50 family metallopeptidase [Actinobacteria bacterium]|nr:M50 family metallopeptidase [Actinomycetota bacterium]